MGDAGSWLPFLLATLLVLGWYLSYTAARLDRLHHRVESTRAALDTQLVRRAAAAAELAALLPPDCGQQLAQAAARALNVGPHDPLTPVGRSGDDPRSLRESELTQVLHQALAVVQAAPPWPAGEPAQTMPPVPPVRPVPPVPAGESGSPVRVVEPGACSPRPGQVGGVLTGPEAAATLRGLARSCERVQLARRFHNDAVAQTLRMRSKRTVRWTRLAGHAPAPHMFDLDDRTPPVLLQYG